MHDLIIIGAGAAGLMAAAEASRLGLKVLVLEGGQKPGAKLFMCGGGRCNATNARISPKDYSAGCAHTLRHVLAGFTTKEALAFFEKWGAPLTLHEDGCYFSADDDARTVLRALLRACSGAEVHCGARVKAVLAQGNGFNVVGGNFLERASAVLVATGGLSYPATGSDGSGYKFAAAFGHQLVATRPALTPFVSSQDTFTGLAGITLDVRLALWASGKKLHAVRGPLLFTHQGFSGPAALEMSRFWIDACQQGAEVRADFFPDVKTAGVEFLFEGAGNRSIKNILAAHMPERLALALLGLVGVDSARRPGMAELNKKDKNVLERALRACPLSVKAVLGYAKAEVTAGGVDLKELKGATLESRLQKGLYFAGEVLDVDGRIGGFNLHWAWASAVSAARAAAKQLSRR